MFNLLLAELETTEIIEVALSDIVFKEEYYPRLGQDKEKIELYRLNLENLPPIILQKSQKILVDGYHRLLAHRIEKQTKIPAKLFDIAENEIMWWSVKLNATHGLQLSYKEKQRLSNIFITNGRDIKEISDVLAAHSDAIAKWTRQTRKRLAQDRDATIWNLFLHCWTQKEIGKKLGIAHTTVGRRLEKVVQSKKILEMHNPPKRWILWNQWSFAARDKNYGMDGVKGRIAGQIIENLLQYFTNPPIMENDRLKADIVVDPMSGGGTTLDVCLTMGRRCLALDIEPLRDDIIQHDIRTGFPERAKSCDLIFLDPPYFDMVFKEEYEDLDAFLGFIHILAKESFETVKNEGYVALLMGDITRDDPIAISGECYHVFRDVGFNLAKYHVAVPHNTQQITPEDRKWAEENNKMLGINRSLWVFQKEV